MIIARSNARLNQDQRNEVPKRIAKKLNPFGVELLQKDVPLSPPREGISVRGSLSGAAYSQAIRAPWPPVILLDLFPYTHAHQCYYCVVLYLPQTTNMSSDNSSSRYVHDPQVHGTTTDCLYRNESHGS
jgi:hypothetical protein